MSSQPRILFVDDDADVRKAASMLLSRRGFVLLPASGPDEAWSMLAAEPVDAILLDLNFSAGATTGAEGFIFLRGLLAHDPDSVVVVVTGHSGINVAVAAMRAGATDFVMKPWNNDRLVATLGEAAALRRTRRGARSGPDRETGPRDPIIGACDQIAAARNLVDRTAPTGAPMLILGETGTGKSLFAQALHRLRTGGAGPIVTIDSAAAWAEGPVVLSRTLADLPGSATLFLDEIGGLPAPGQLPLATALAARPDLRLVAASRRTRQALASGLLPDLLYRLNTVEVVLPPLRERGRDVRLLAEHFLRLFAQAYGRPGLTLLPTDMDAIAACTWPGNVRALRLAIERAVVLAIDRRLAIDDIILAGTRGDDVAGPALATGDLNLAKSERALVEAALKRHGFNVSLAARDLGLTRAALYRRMARYKL